MSSHRWFQSRSSRLQLCLSCWDLITPFRKSGLGPICSGRLGKYCPLSLYGSGSGSGWELIFLVSIKEWWKGPTLLLTGFQVHDPWIVTNKHGWAHVSLCRGTAPWQRSFCPKLRLKIQNLTHISGQCFRSFLQPIGYCPSVWPTRLVSNQAIVFQLIPLPILAPSQCHSCCLLSPA